jgi:3-oxoacyl-[acyl-carrier protein] reductase
VIRVSANAELNGTVALVTGASRNIGRAIARALAAGGAAVVVNARISRKEAEETVGLIESDGGRAAAILADVTDADAVSQMVAAAVRQFGRLDLLVNNAAVRDETALADITLDHWRRVLSVVLDGAFLCAQACLPHLIRSGRGAIVNIGGLTAYTGAVGRAHVAAAKSGLGGLTRALALELAPHNVTVNVVVPGTIDTTRDTTRDTASAPAGTTIPAPRASLPPVGRRGQPAEVAALVRMLCGPAARYITGQAMHVNGGGFLP